MSEIAVIGDYDIRDRKLADETSKSSVATTDSIRMKDTDGNEVYIARDSFVDAVRSALGPILTNMTQKTAASGGVLVNDSNDVGTMNLSNLASVLGVLRELGWASVNDANKMSKGMCLTHSAVTSNLPSVANNCYIVDFMNTVNNEDFQFCVGLESSAIWLRSKLNGNWKEWKQL